MIAWSDEALEAALDSFYGPNWRGKYQETNNEMRNDMRAALDAAVKAQGITEIKRDYPSAAAQYRAEALEEVATWFEGKGGVIPGASVYASLVSRNKQPCMSGDPRDRLNKYDRRDFDEATAWVSERIRALKETNG